eukprot:6265180-Amphidinium_carterae.1
MAVGRTLGGEENDRLGGSVMLNGHNTGTRGPELPPMPSWWSPPLQRIDAIALFEDVMTTTKQQEIGGTLQTERPQKQNLQELIRQGNSIWSAVATCVPLRPYLSLCARVNYDFRCAIGYISEVAYES